MSYEVKFGFGKSDLDFQKLFLEKNKLNNAEGFIVTHVCFATFLENRVKDKKQFKESPVYYTLHCNYYMLRKLVKWINELNSGIKVTICEKDLVGGLIKADSIYDEELFTFIPKYRSFEFGSKYEFVEKDDELFKKYRSLIMRKCTIKIEIASDDIIVKGFLEYITMCVIRFLEKRELFLINLGGKESIQEKIVKASNSNIMGHSLYDNSEFTDTFYRSNNSKRIYLSLDELVKSLNVVNMTNGINKSLSNKWNFYSIRQTFIFNIVLERKNNNYNW